MSQRPVHEAAARANEAAARQLEGTGQAELIAWVPTLIFYVGVQLVEAALADYGAHMPDHGSRRAAMVAHWPQAGAPYKKLQELSTFWRYKGQRPSDSDCRAAWHWMADLAVAIGEPWPPT